MKYRLFKDNCVTADPRPWLLQENYKGESSLYWGETVDSAIELSIRESFISNTAAINPHCWDVELIHEAETIEELRMLVLLTGE